MSPFALDLEKTRQKTSLMMIEPALNAFGSMLLLSKGGDEPGVHEWVTKTLAKLSAEEMARHNLVLIGFHYAILPVKSGCKSSTPPSKGCIAFGVRQIM